MTAADSPLAPLVAEFAQALRLCAELFDQAAATTLRELPERLPCPAREFPGLMRDLHRGLLLKVFVDVVHADRHLGPGEELLAAELAAHLTGKPQSPAQVKKLLARAEADVRGLDWTTLVGPFAQFPPLRGRVAELQTLVMRLANLVGKIEGRAAPETVAQISMIQYALWQQLGRPDAPPVAAPVAETSRCTSAAHELAELIEPVPAPEKAVEIPPAPPERLDDVLAELDALVGIAEIKREVRCLANFLRMQGERRRLGLPADPVTLHMIFSGNPGTGKTTVARLVGRIFRAMGILAKGHLVETDRSGLVAEYAGQTGPKTHRKIDEALDGVLFVDEAYSLVSASGDDPYGDEAIQALLKRVEDDRARLVVILAGYPGPLDELLASNPGLTSRFPRRLEFPDYSADELCAIFRGLCARNHYVLGPGAAERLAECFAAALAAGDEHFGNGRSARNLFEDAIRRMADRIAAQVPLTRELLTTLEAGDLHADVLVEARAVSCAAQ
ncbi:MAG: AAA family ATPase [Pirellulales bacterium]|nr:AAA family ATPase [Pirellulales bacterium]